MAERTVKTDIIIAIHPKHVLNIVSRVKDHEYRNYLIPSSVRRIWIYETSPTSAIKYVAQISPGKRPGQVTNPLGLLNTEFNEGKLEHSSKYAYEILDLQAIPDPWTLQNLKDKGWLNGPPQKYCYVKESMIAAFRDMTMTKVFDTRIPDADVVEAGSPSKPTSGNVCEGSEDVATSQKPLRESARKSTIPAKLVSKPTGIAKRPPETSKAKDQQGALMKKWLESAGRG